MFQPNPINLKNKQNECPSALDERRSSRRSIEIHEKSAFGLDFGDILEQNGGFLWKLKYLRTNL